MDPNRRPMADRATGAAVQCGGSVRPSSLWWVPSPQSRGRGHFAADTSVTFMEACDIEAVGRGVRGLASPHPFLVPLLAGLFGVFVLLETYSFGFLWFRIVRFLWSYSGYSTCVSRRWLWLLFHTFQCECGQRILRSILGEILIYWEMTSIIFRFLVCFVRQC